ncbi:hypothetical protein D3C86_2187150 [compost metagenome]
MIAGGGIHGHQPDASNPKVVFCRRITVIEIIKLLGKPLQIANTVTIRVIEGTDKNFIKNSRRLLVNHGSC